METRPVATTASDGRRPDCRGANEYGCSIVTIHLQSPKGTMAMDSCSACDQRWWRLEGEQLDRDAALDDLG